MENENKYIDAYYKIGRLTPRDMLDEEIKFSADLVKEACEKAIEYEKLKNKISELENKISMINAQNQVYKKDTNLVELVISLRDLNLITSDYTYRLSKFILNHDLNEDDIRIKKLQSIITMAISKVFENSKIKCSCNVDAVICIVQSLIIKGFDIISPCYPWE